MVRPVEGDRQRRPAPTDDEVSSTHTALVVPVPDAEGICRLALLGVRQRSSAPLAHITLVTPFVDEAKLDATVIRAIADIASTVAAFSFVLTSCEEFDDGWYYAAPDKPEPFIELTRRVCNVFPGLAPYGGAHDELVPHMSIGVESNPTLRHELMAESSRSLPLAARASELMIVRSGPDDWAAVERIRLGGSHP
jgi:hypothetical protein